MVLGRWLPQQVFIDYIAIGNILPAPLVIFATFVGFQGGYVHGGLGYAFAGATVITIGMLSLCFIFTIIGHHVLETLVCNKVCQCLPTFPFTFHFPFFCLQFLSAFFDGICGSIVGIIAIIAIQILGETVGSKGRIKPTTVDDVLVVASHDVVAAVLYLLALSVLYMSTHKYTSILLVLCGALASQFLFV